MSQYCIPLNLDLFPLKNSVNLGALYNNAYSSLEHDQLNPRLVDLLNSVGLEVTLVEIFCRRPSKRTVIHTDGAGGDYVKINWVLGGAGSTMEWYQPRPGQQKPVATNTIYLLDQSGNNLNVHSDDISNVPLIRRKNLNISFTENESLIISEQFDAIQKVAYDIFKLTEKLKIG
jgi:hypothetical protein